MSIHSEYIRPKLSYIYLTVTEVPEEAVGLSADSRGSVLRLLSPACRVANLTDSDYLPSARLLRVVDDAKASSILDEEANGFKRRRHNHDDAERTAMLTL